MPFHSRDRLLTPAQAERYTGLPRRTIRYYASIGRLRFEVVAGAQKPTRRFRVSALDQLLSDDPSTARATEADRAFIELRSLLALPATARPRQIVEAARARLEGRP
jgi:hypothetical protein